METSLIEKLDKSRYNLLKWFTIGWTLWFGGFILKDWISNNFILVLLFLIGFLGWIIFAVSLNRMIKLGKIVKSDTRLRDALDDELMVHNRNKSFVVGFWTFSVLIGLFMVLSIFIDIPTLMICELTLYFGILSFLGSSLIFNKA